MSDRPTVQFLFDFGSPNAYLAHLVLPGIEERTGARFEYVPILLGGVFKATHNQPPMVALAGIRNKPEYQQLEMRRFLERHGIESFRFNPDFPINTLQIMRGAVFARRHDWFERYVDEVFRHMWSDTRKLDDEGVLRQALLDSSLPADEILEGVRTPEIKQELIRNTEDAVERGVFGSPSFFVGDELFFGKDRLRDVEEEIAKTG